MSETAGKSAFTVTDTAKAAGAAPAVVRRGRGTFQQRLRTEQHEKEHQQQQQMQQAREMSDTSSTLTSATTTVTLSIMPRTIQAAGDANATITTAAATPQEALYRKAKDYEEDLKASLSVPATTKKDIPLHVTTPPVWRENFGVYDEYTEEADTVRQLLFRSEKRRRYCIIVGDLQSTQRVVTLKLFGHRGLKPFQLQNKVIRLINLSIGRPRPRRTAEGEAGNDGDGAAGGDESNDEEGSAAADTRELEYARNITAAPEAEANAGPELTAESLTRKEEDEKAAAAATRESTHDSEERTRRSSTEASYSTGAPNTNTHRSKANAATSSVGKEASVAANDDAMLYHDVDHYFENDDDVVPLTVQRADGAEDGMTNEASLANSPVLTSRYFETLNEYFLREFRFLLGMADVRTQNVTVDISLGAAYYCLPRHCSYTTPLTQATFGEFVERLNQESLQLHFIKDCPPCVSRAVDMECGALNHEANLTSVRIIFFSNERQSRSIARAVWDSEEDRFRLLDVENVGVSFRWTIFSLDETFARTAAQKAAAEAAAARAKMTTAGLATALQAVGEEARDVEADAPEETPCTEEALMRKKTIAYPFEIEFRAFRRWKQHGDHPAGRLAEAILDKLSLAEHNLIHHGSSIGYERMDLSHVCEIDYASEDFNVESIIVDHTARGRPQGTDLLVDNTTSLFIENFAAARQLKEKIEQYGPEAVAAMQNHSNNNYIRGRARMARGSRSRGLGQDEEASLIMEEALKAPSKLTFFRSRGSTIHWKFRPSRDVEENIAPMTEALHFVQQVLNTANDIERNSVRGGAGPEAI